MERKAVQPKHKDLGEGKVLSVFGDIENEHRTVYDWTAMWQKGQNTWQKAGVHRAVLTHKETWLGGRSHIKIFFPLCGKDMSMIWLYEKGHTVIGVEYVDRVVEEFFKENNLQFIAESLDGMNGKVFKTADNRLKVYSCDLFEFCKEMECGFHAVYDDDSLIAVHPDDRKRYVQLISSLAAPDCAILLRCAEYDTTVYNTGPPYSITEKQIHDLYESRFNIERLETFEAISDATRTWGLDSFMRSVYLITTK